VCRWFAGNVVWSAGGTRESGHRRRFDRQVRWWARRDVPPPHDDGRRSAQFSAVLNLPSAVKSHSRFPYVCPTAGVVTLAASGHFALAAGASNVMIGSWFRGAPTIPLRPVGERDNRP